MAIHDTLNHKIPSDNISKIVFIVIYFHLFVAIQDTYYQKILIDPSTFCLSKIAEFCFTYFFIYLPKAIHDALNQEELISQNIFCLFEVVKF